MIDLVMGKVLNGQFMFSLMVAVAAAATALMLALPLLDKDSLNQRLRSVGAEREKMRSKERERLNQQNKPNLRHNQKVAFKSFVENFNLSEWLGTSTSKTQLLQAGFRSKNSEVTFLFFRLVCPIAFFAIALLYVFVIFKSDYSTLTRFGMSLTAAFIGLKAPEIFLNNIIQKRKQSIRRAWPDALDLMLICVESGMSIEQAFRKVAQEIGTQSVYLAEELTLTTAELSYLSERRQAYENLVMRCDLEMVKAVCTALVQADKYGTPVGAALRVLAQESRDQRMNEAEKKAAALPPKLTVPMIVFFLPVLFIVILVPAVIQINGLK